MDIIISRKRGARFRRTDFSPEDKLNGVVVYLYDKGIIAKEEAYKVIEQYGNHIGHTFTGQNDPIEIAVKIQDNFPGFVSWFKSL